MATYTTNFSDWTTFENLLAASDAYEQSSAYTTIIADVGYLSSALFTGNWSVNFVNSTLITCYYNGMVATIHGTNLGTVGATITEATLSNGATNLTLGGSIKFSSGHYVGSITSMHVQSGGYSATEVGVVSLTSTTWTLSHLTSTEPTALGNITIDASVAASVSPSGGTIKYSAVSLADDQGHSLALSNLNFTVTGSSQSYDQYTVTVLHDMLSGNDNCYGGSGADALCGFAGNDLLDGKAGADRMAGGTGNDTYIVDNLGDVVSENFGEGTDLVKSSVGYTLPDNVENLTLTGAGPIAGTGNGLDNTLTGNSGDNLLDGGAGTDALAGGAGNDTYLVDLIPSGGDAAAALALQDKVTELANGGNDTIVLRGSFPSAAVTTLTLAANVENLDASATGTTPLNLAGNTLSNVLTGNGADNVLDGGAGNDTLKGGAGNDTYIVGSTGDVVAENAGEGSDLVMSSVSYALPANVEGLTLTGTASINGTGNELDNVLTGNSAANILDGGSGSDTLAGGKGNDTYIVDAAGDTVLEGAGGGIDLVKSAVSYALPDNVEKLTLTGSADSNATGNALNNTLTGNAGSNILDGGSGTDTLAGGAGNDTYLVDLILKGSGTTASAALQDTISEAANAGNDTIALRGVVTLSNATTLTLGANIENLDASATGSTLLKLTGNALDNALTGNDANNVLDGKGGNDTLTGGAGADTFLISTTPGTTNVDTVTDFVSGTDRLQLSHGVFAKIVTTNSDHSLANSEFYAAAGATAPVQASQHVVFDTTSGTLYYFNGSTSTAVAVLSGVNNLTAADIYCI